MCFFFFKLETGFGVGQWLEFRRVLFRSHGKENITFPEPGIYKVILRPTGDLPLHRIEFDNRGDRKKLIRIEQWGNVRWRSEERRVGKECRNRGGPRRAKKQKGKSTGNAP